MLPRASLAATLWPEELESEARANLRRHLYRLAHALPSVDGVEWVAGDNLQVGWNPAAPASIDVRDFEALAAAGRKAEAADLYRGDFLDGFYEDYVLAERERLRALQTEMLLSLSHEARGERNFAGAAAYAQRLLDIDEWREDALRLWMIAKYESGERSAAIAAYERFARRLREEFSAEPAAETVAVRDAIRAEAPLPAEPSQVFERQLSDPARRGWKLPLVGRAAELDRLRAAWSRAARGSGSVAFLSGEAGIGKSRLAAELVGLVRDQGGQALVGVTSHPEGEPYQSVLVALRAAISAIAHARIDDTWLAALAHVLPELRGLRDGLASEELLPNRARDRLFEAFVRVVEHLGRARPLCVVLEDLHWAGPATIDLVGALARRIGTLPVLLVATYRSEESAASDPLRTLRAALIAERRATAAPLERLAPQDVDCVLRSAVQDEAARASLGEGIARLSEGNPLFVVQLIEGYLETGSVPDESSALRSVGDAIALRARRLSAGVRAVAEVASTIGASFRADLVADAGGWDENVVLDAVGELMDRALVRESGGELEYVFTHALVGASFYRDSPPELRTARHRRIATLLERSRGSAPESAALLARHWRLAGEPARAARASIRAGEAALHLYARAEAMAHARQALDLTADVRDRFDALLLLSRAQQGHGDAAQWRRDLDALCDCAQELGVDERFAALDQRASFEHQIADRTAQRATIEAMLALVEAGATPRMRCTALLALGRLESMQGRVPQSLAALEAALAIACECGAADLEIDARHMLAHSLSRTGRYDEARHQVVALRDAPADAFSMRRKTRALQAEIAIAGSRQEMGTASSAAAALLELARTSGDMELEVAALTQIAFGLHATLDAPAVRARYGEALALAERIGFEAGIETVWQDLGVFEARIGNHRGAIASLGRSLEIARRGTGSNIGYALSNTARELLLVGEKEAALAAAREADAFAQSIDERRLCAAASVALGLALFASGERDPGLEKMRCGIEIRRSIGDVAGFAKDLCEYAEAALAAGLTHDYASIAGELAALAESPPEGVDLTVRLPYTYGLLLDAAGDPGAAQWFDRGRERLAEQLERVPDEETRRYLEAQPFNRALLARPAPLESVRGTRKVRRSS